MYLIATFEYKQFLEQAVTEMQMRGFSKERILATPLDKRDEERRFFDMLRSHNGLSLLDLALALGIIFMLLGNIYGLILAWSPIGCGLIGLVIGFAIGFIIKLKITKKYAKHRVKAEKSAEVVLIIKCEKYELETVRSALSNNHTLCISKLDFANSPFG